MNESNESFMNRTKREEKETSEIKYELLLKISTDSDIVRLMIICSFVDKLNCRFRYNHLPVFTSIYQYLPDNLSKLLLF
jgi:hypothetical protein